MDLETIMALLGLVVGLMAVGWMMGYAIVREINLHREEEGVPIRIPKRLVDRNIIKEAERIIDDHLQREALRRHNK